jgi:hypothetical protein
MQIEDKLKANVDKIESCWVWNKSTASSGYGQIKVGNRRWSTHRLSYTLFKGCIPKGMLVCHTCDNKRCVNPEHLYLGTHVDNNQDAHDRNRQPCREGYLATGVVKLSKEDAYTIKYSGISSKQLEKAFDINQSQVSRIRNGKTWKNI